MRYNQRMNRLARLFTGRVSRQQFLLGSLLVLALMALVSIISALIVAFTRAEAVILLVSILAAALMIAATLFLFGLAARRIHDIGKSGWYALLLLVSPFNIVVLLVLAVERGQEGDTGFGPLPRRRRLLDVVTNAEESSSPGVPDETSL